MRVSASGEAPPPRAALRLVPSDSRTGDDAAQPAARRFTVALVGQPNVGKSTVFNMLTGLSQHVGNWPGKTIEQKSGTFRQSGLTLGIVDLPGTYSLTANSEEERIARNYLLRERPDVVMAVVNAASLERSLYLVAELLVLGLPVVVGLNMIDVAEQHGIHVEPHVLAAALGVPVVPLVAAHNIGLQEFVAAAVQVASDPTAWHPNRPEIRAEHAPVLAELVGVLERCQEALRGYPADWLALKLLEGDTEITALVRDAAPPNAWDAIHQQLSAHEDAFLDIAGGRYEWIGRMVRAAVTRPRAGAVIHTERLDRVATHQIGGLVLLLAIFGVVFWLTYTVATPIADWLSGTVLGGISAVTRSALSASPAWLSGLLVDGLLGGAGTVIAFVPMLVVFFMALGFLEDVGYLARGAYVMDRFMHLMGLHGKSFLPLFLGFGCNVPAVMGARILEDRRARLLTILLAPLVPCTARLAVVAFLAPAFFGRAAAIVSLGLVAGNLVVLALVGISVNRLVFRGEQTAFIMELPLYHVPNLRTVGLYVWHNVVAFLKKAGSLILLASAVVWALSSLPGGDIQTSVLAEFGRWLAPVGALMGLADWRLVVALLSSFFAKENTIATLGILFGAGGGTSGLAEQVATVLSPAAMLAFLVVQMLFVPCLATVVTMRQENGSWRWTAAGVLLLLILSYGAGVLVYQAVRVVLG